MLCAEAINTVYLRNRSIVSNHDKTPYEIFFGKKPDISRLRTFGTQVMQKRTDENGVMI